MLSARIGESLQPPTRQRSKIWRRSTQYSIVLNMINKTTVNSESRSRGQPNHVKPSARTFAPPPLTGRDTLGERAVRWILPWTVRNYPGVRRGMVEVLGRHVTYSAVKGWRVGRRPMPAWAAQILAHTIQTRCRAGADLAAELEQWAQHRAQIEAERQEIRRRQFSAVRRRR
jgi:hypothetical protein